MKWFSRLLYVERHGVRIKMVGDMPIYSRGALIKISRFSLLVKRLRRA